MNKDFNDFLVFADIPNLTKECVGSGKEFVIEIKTENGVTDLNQITAYILSVSQQLTISLLHKYHEWCLQVDYEAIDSQFSPVE